MNWKKIGKVVNEEGTTVCYEAEGTDVTIESRKRHVPHSNRPGTWDCTKSVFFFSSRPHAI